MIRGTVQPSFGVLLRWHRIKAGLTQEALAENARLSVRGISDLERGARTRPRQATLQLLADALDLPPADRETLWAAARRQAGPSSNLLASVTPTADAAVRMVGAAPERASPPEPAAGIPPDRMAHFVGRDAELAELRRALLRDGRVAVHGLGGVGKTQLVVRYLHEWSADYPEGVFWLRADQESSLVGDLASLAWRLDLPERIELEQARQVEAVLRWLRRHRRWLLVLDNMELETQEAVRHWLPPGLSGHLLLTSRSPMWTTRLELQPLPAHIAGRFLLDRAGQSDERAALAVADMLGGLPLALEQAAAYMHDTGCSLAAYSDLARTRLVELMREGRPRDYPNSVATTWALSFGRIEQESPAATAVLRLCACLGPDNIPLRLLRQAATQLQGDSAVTLGDEIGLDLAIGTLRRYAMIARQGEMLRIHRLVQTVVRDLPSRQEWIAVVLRMLQEVFPADVHNPATWSDCASLAPHVQEALATIGVDETLEPAATSSLLDRLGSYLQARGEFAPARPLLERALIIDERVLGPDHPDTAISLLSLAALLRAQGEMAAARPLFERALAISERVLGPEHPETAASLSSLGALLRDQGEWAVARSVFERALEIRERVLGPDHPATAASLNNLGILLRDQGELAAARPFLERALEIRERVLGPDHPQTANSLNNLARLLRHQGELVSARPLLERALQIRERVLGPEHPETAASLNNLARLLRDQGELAAARSILERALEIRSRVLGSEHPNTAVSLDNLACVLHAQGELVAARPLHERALQIRERVLGPEHPETATTLCNLALLLRDQDKMAAARLLLERALRIRNRILGPDHWRVITTQRSLDELVAHLKDRAGATHESG